MNNYQIADYFGLSASILLPLTPLPQLWKIYKTKKTKDIALWYILLQILANTCFLIFGILKTEIFVIIPNLALIIMNFIIILLKFYFE